MRIRVKLIRDGGVRNDTATAVAYGLYDVVNESRRCRAVNGICADVHVRQTHVRVYADMGKRNEKERENVRRNSRRGCISLRRLIVNSNGGTYSTFTRVG